MAAQTTTVSFRCMEEGTVEDYEALHQSEQDYICGLLDRILVALVKLEGCLSGYQVSRLEHCLEIATRAERNGAEMTWILEMHDLFHTDKLVEKMGKSLSRAQIL